MVTYVEPGFPVPEKRTAPAASVPFSPARKWSGVLPDKFVATLVELVSTQALRDDVAALAAFHTRHTFSTQISAAADHLVSRLDAADRAQLDLAVDFSVRAEHLHRYPIVFSHDQDGVPSGKETVEITAVKEVADMFFGNPRTMEVHLVTCPWWPRISPAHKVPFFALRDAVARGYDGCAYCLPNADHG